LANAVRVDVDANATSRTTHVFTGFQLSTDFSRPMLCSRSPRRRLDTDNFNDVPIDIWHRAFFPFRQDPIRRKDDEAIPEALQTLRPWQDFLCQAVRCRICTVSDTFYVIYPGAATERPKGFKAQGI
jgi:hypothetical protein